MGLIQNIVDRENSRDFMDNKEDVEWARQFDYLEYLMFIYRDYVQEVEPCQ